MAKTQLGARVDENVKDLAQGRANDRGQSVGDYIAQLILDDVSGMRVRGRDAAKAFLKDFQDVFDEAEDCQQKDSSGVRAA